jgi:hypothetical protein
MLIVSALNQQVQSYSMGVRDLVVEMVLLIRYTLSAPIEFQSLKGTIESLPVIDLQFAFAYWGTGNAIHAMEVSSSWQT